MSPGDLRAVAEGLLADANRVGGLADELAAVVGPVESVWRGPGQRRMQSELTSEQRDLMAMARELRVDAHRLIAQAEAAEAAAALAAGYHQIATKDRVVL